VILNMRENMARLQQDVTALLSYVRDELLKNESELKGRFEQALVRVERGPLMVQTRHTHISLRTSGGAAERFGETPGTEESSRS
jgi:hypothetical protein